MNQGLERGVSSKESTTEYNIITIEWKKTEYDQMGRDMGERGKRVTWRGTTKTKVVSY